MHSQSAVKCCHIRLCTVIFKFFGNCNNNLQHVQIMKLSWKRKLALWLPRTYYCIFLDSGKFLHLAFPSCHEIQILKCLSTTQLRNIFWIGPMKNAHDFAWTMCLSWQHIILKEGGYLVHFITAPNCCMKGQAVSSQFRLHSTKV